MDRVLKAFVAEFKKAIPPTLFFLVAFHVTAYTRVLTEESLGLTPVASTMATISALIVGKTSLLLNHLRATNLFSRSPLIVSILWKTLIFSLLATIARGVEELVHVAIKYGSLRVGIEHLFEDIVWPRFWANHIVLLQFVFLYSLAVELIRIFGAERLKALFLTRGAMPVAGPERHGV